MDTVYPEIVRIAKLIDLNKGSTYLVGGCVRDYLLKSTPKDFDVEVYGLDYPKLMSILSEHYEIDLVGQAFGVIKIKGLPIDISLPRTESKAGVGHKEFLVNTNPNLSLEEACARRDFTINSMMIHVLTGNLVDIYGGKKDLENKILRHVSDKFSEDPLRVLRGMQFVARFDLKPDPDTVSLCKTIPFENLPTDRLWEEWKKLILKGNNIKAGLEFLLDAGWGQYFPEVSALRGSEQSPDHHPEGDVLIHTGLCLNHFAKNRIGDEYEDTVVGLGVLTHDFGKPKTWTRDERGIHNYGHDVAGVDVARTFLERLTKSQDLISDILPLVRWHMAPSQYFKNKAGDRAVRRMSLEVQRIDRLIRVCEADTSGRPPIVPSFDHLVWLREKATNLKVVNAPLRPILKGTHLIALNQTPGTQFGVILKEAFEAQVEGKFDTEEQGVAYLRQLLKIDQP